MSAMKQVWQEMQDAADQPPSTGFDYVDYVIKQLRDRPEQIAELQKSLNSIGCSMDAMKDQLSYFEAIATAEAAANKENKNADQRKAAARLLLDGNKVYQALKDDIESLQNQKDSTTVALSLAENRQRNARSEAALLAAIMGGNQ